ncbi:sensor histidine kinase [Ruminiclostridium cellobioparum]|uniref:Integral membrane sensor signal transduction histidine kinase n=1 Tax=Ruminiclostridium cellobioparum subsp. termitidis CT1112 TaxID=1195236 RepID=S0FHT7_RUMCE|nr:histidine kinase [Ruminiclostridium cellobioparum]EMS69546.1 integral membrane sensor signal transduction histidine kinase [Ruminiclostridium cellobioparum subsp. termitidis CT1112]
MLKNVSYLTKLLLAYSTIIGLLFLIFISIYYEVQVKNLKKSSQDNLIQMTSRVSDQFKGVLDEMSRISRGVAISSEVQAAMNEIAQDNAPENYFYFHPQGKSRIQDVIIGLNGTYFNNRSFNVISKNYDYVGVDIYNGVTLDKKALSRITWIRYVLENNISKYISPVSEDMYGRSRNETFSFVRLIQNEYKTYGVIDVQFEKTYLDKIFTMELSGYPVHTVVVKDDNTMFYSTGGAPAGAMEPLVRNCEVGPGSQTIQSMSLDGKKYIVCSTLLNDYDMKLYLLVNTEHYLASVNNTTTVFVICAVTILAALLLIVYGVTQSLYKPIRQLRDNVSRIDYATISVDLQVADTNNEVTQLTHAFEKMLEDIRHATGELMQLRTREIQAYYKMLQAQINPHFMHNILAVIGMMGRQKNAPEIMDMCSALTRMLSYSTDTTQSTVTIQQELEHVSNYLKLMKYRYLDYLEYTLEIDECLKQVTIPKFVLQPIAENCFQHSLQDAEPPYRIIIRGSIDENGWNIAIEDNGRGFTEGAIARLKEQFETVNREIDEGMFSSDFQIGGLALINTYGRLRLYSNGKIRLDLSNTPDGGSRVVISFEGE